MVFLILFKGISSNGLSGKSDFLEGGGVVVVVGFSTATSFAIYFFTADGSKLSTSCLRITPLGPEPCPIYYIFTPLKLARALAAGLAKILPPLFDDDGWELTGLLSEVAFEAGYFFV